MKEATGEFSMTVITIIAVIAIAGIIAWLTPLIRDYVQNSWNSVTNPTACPTGQTLQPNGTCK